MQLPVIPNIIRTTVFGNLEGGTRWSNTYHFRKVAGSTYASAINEIHTQLQTLYSAAGYGGTNFGWAHYASNGSVADSIISTPLDGVTPSIGLTIAIAGTSANDCLPGQSSVQTTFVTAKRGRSYRGRTYWAAFTTATMDTAGHFAVADVNFMQTMWTAFATAIIAAADLESHVVASYLHSTSEDVLTYTVRSVYGHQVKRRGHGA